MRPIRRSVTPGQRTRINGSTSVAMYEAASKFCRLIMLPMKTTSCAAASNENGSVIPKFEEQIARGGPITVTNPDIIRYFMTISEAARLVIQVAAIGESGQVPVLDMGDPVEIVDLGLDMIKLSGHSVDDILIEFTGMRLAEKLF